MQYQSNLTETLKQLFFSIEFYIWKTICTINHFTNQIYDRYRGAARLTVRHFSSCLI